MRGITKLNFRYGLTNLTSNESLIWFISIRQTERLFAMSNTWFTYPINLSHLNLIIFTRGNKTRADKIVRCP